MKVASFCHLPGQSLSVEHLPCPAQCNCEVRSPCGAGGWTPKASARRSVHAHRGAEPQGSARVSRDLMHMPVLTGYCNPWALLSVSNCSVFIELIALLHRLNKPPWVVFPAWGQLPLLNITKQLWGANGVWRNRSGPSWQRWPGCGAACGQEGLFGKAACKTERLTWRAVGPLCLPNNLFSRQFPSPVFFGLLKFILLGGEVSSERYQCVEAVCAGKSICMLL